MDSSKNTKRSKRLNTIIFTVGLVIFLGSLAMIVNFFFIEPHQNNETMKEIEDLYYEGDSSNGADAQSDVQNMSSGANNTETLKRGDLNAIQAVNPDIKGWIRINDSVVNYPVLQSSKSNPEFYLHKNYKKNYSGFGSIFIDSLCEVDKPSQNIIMYGHNMRDGSMFGTLLKYDKMDYYKKRPVIMFDTTKENAVWKIISIFKTNTLEDQGKLFQYLMIDFASEKDFLEYVYNVRVRSLINTPVDVGPKDHLITLSTCSYELKDFRTVVVARKVRAGESEQVDVNKASVNSKPLMPAGFYKKYGGSMPAIESFEDALRNGHLSWLRR